MVALSDFSGLVSSACALARAAAIAPIDSLDRCMDPLPLHEVEAHRPGFAELGPNAVAKGLLGVLGHEALELGVGFLVLEKGMARVAVQASELAPGVRGAH